LLRHEDVTGSSGTGIVAEGVIFDNGMCSMCWLSEISTVTVFPKITAVKKLHGHAGKTEVILEGKDQRFTYCQQQARIKKDLRDREIKNEKE
jgi:hypothetical protein